MKNEQTKTMITALAEGTELAQMIEIEPDHVQPLHEYCHRNHIPDPLDQAREGHAVLLVVSQVEKRLRVHLSEFYTEPEELGLLCVLSTPEQLEQARRFLTHPRYRSTLWHISQTTHWLVLVPELDAFVEDALTAICTIELLAALPAPEPSSHDLSHEGPFHTKE